MEIKGCLNCGAECSDKEGDFCSWECDDIWANEGTVKTLEAEITCSECGNCRTNEEGLNCTKEDRIKMKQGAV